MIWFSIGNSGNIGTTSMALPMPKHFPSASTRLDGFAAADTTDRLATLLCRKYDRQIFVSAHLPRTQVQMIQSEDDNGEEVIIKKVLIELRRVIAEEKDRLETKLDQDPATRTSRDRSAIKDKVDLSTIGDGLGELIIDS